VAIEALNNIVKHADADQVVVNLQAINGSLQLDVGDNGCGFDLEQVTDGFGLRSIQERVEGLGGRLDIASAPGQGTNISIKVELDNE
jgi:two-component system sensor histidine kinase UhpB